MKLLYPTSLHMDPTLLSSLPCTIHSYDVTQPIPPSHHDAEILITWSNAPSNLTHAATHLPNLRLIQSLAAGPNDVLAAGFNPSTIAICTGSGLHDHTVAEHALGMLLLAARRFDEMKEYQLRSEWPGHLGGPQPDRPQGRFTSLRGANVLVWGYGNIAKTLAPHLKSLGANVKGVARSKGMRDGVEVISEEEMEEALKSTDALVMILPGSDATRNKLNAARIAQMQKHAWVVNVGRGTTVDEEALADALEEGRLGGAALDVFVTEPLPKGSRLWKARNCIVSPHAAGGRPQGAEELIVENVTRLVEGRELKNAYSARRVQSKL